MGQLVPVLMRSGFATIATSEVAGAAATYIPRYRRRARLYPDPWRYDPRDDYYDWSPHESESASDRAEDHPQ